MDKREQGLIIKKIVREITGDTNVSVRSGRGTAHYWWYIKAKATREQEDLIEKILKERGLVSFYYQDIGPMSDYQPCINWLY